MARQRSNNSNNGNQGQSLSQSYGSGGSSNDGMVKMTLAKKNIIGFFAVLPALLLLGYSSGLWTPKTDAFDNISSAFSIMCGFADYFILRYFLGDNDD